MKLNFGQRLLLIVHWILSLIGCLIAALLLITPNTVYGMIDSVYASIGKRAFDTIGIVLCAIYILIAAGCAAMLFSGFGKRGERGLITVFSNDTGKTRIAVSAVEQMARQAIAGVDGISDVRAAITGAEDAIGVNISLVLKRGAYLPTVTTNIQRTVRGYIEQNCGVAVQSIIVNVRAVEGEAPNAGKGAKTEAPVLKDEIPDASFDLNANAGETEFAPADTVSETEPVQPENTDSADSEQNDINE